MKPNTMIAIAVASLIPLAGTALANEGYDKDKGKAGASFDTLDTNRDGRISRAEAAVGYHHRVEQRRRERRRLPRHHGVQEGDEVEVEMIRRRSRRLRSSQSAPMPEETVPPQGETTTPPTDTETPRQ